MKMYVFYSFIHAFKVIFLEYLTKFCITFKNTSESFLFKLFLYLELENLTFIYEAHSFNLILPNNNFKTFCYLIKMTLELFFTHFPS